MGNQLLSRPVSQQFDQTFQNAGFSTLAGVNAPSVVPPQLQQQAAAQPMQAITQQQAPQQLAASIPKQVVPRTVGMSYQMPRWGVSSGFRGTPMRTASL